VHNTRAQNNMQQNLDRSYITNNQTAAIDIVHCTAKTTDVSVANSCYIHVHGAA